MKPTILLINETAAAGRRLAERLLMDLLPRAPRSQILTVTTIQAAQREISARRLDLVIAPLRLDNQGITLAQELRERSPETSVLLLGDETVSPFQERLASHLGARLLPASVSETGLCAAVVDLIGRRQVGFANPPSPLGASAGALAPEQTRRLDETLAGLGRESGIACVMLLDTSGQELAIWHRAGRAYAGEIAALAAGKVQAAGELSRSLGTTNPDSTVILEHHEHIVLSTRFDAGLILLLVTEPSVPLGWSRLALRRTAETVRSIIAVREVDAVRTLGPEFERSVAARIGAIVETPGRA